MRRRRRFRGTHNCSSTRESPAHSVSFFVPPVASSRVVIEDLYPCAGRQWRHLMQRWRWCRRSWCLPLRGPSHRVPIVHHSARRVHLYSKPSYPRSQRWQRILVLRWWLLLFILPWVCMQLRRWWPSRRSRSMTLILFHPRGHDHRTPSASSTHFLRKQNQDTPPVKSINQSINPKFNLKQSKTQLQLFVSLTQ